MLFYSFFKTLVGSPVKVELKNDLIISGTLISVDQFLNIKLDATKVENEDKFPHMMGVKNSFIRGSVVSESDQIQIESDQMSVLIDTTLGELVIDLYTEKCYRSSLNFLKLCKLKRYNFHPFYTIIKNHAAQISAQEFQKDLSVWGLTEGNSYFKPEVKFGHDQMGLVSFNTQTVGDHLVASSQFFISLAGNSNLDREGAVFGKVVEGLDVLEKINNALCDEDHRPFVDIRIKHTVILDDPFDDVPGMEELIPPTSPIPTEEMLKTCRISANEKLLTEKERIEQERIEEMKASQLTLEMIGDLPFAEIKPPENVLFVCKLNPVTRDDDLALIFGRFGKLLSCEIVKDKFTGQSLCYAFIEYENKEDCEMAFLKMNNVLIDDKRIKVDFSQSVSKLNQDFQGERKSSIYGHGLRKRTKYREQDEEDEYELVLDPKDHDEEKSDRKERLKDQKEKKDEKYERRRDEGDRRRGNYRQDRYDVTRDRRDDRPRSRERHDRRDDRPRSRDRRDDQSGRHGDKRYEREDKRYSNESNREYSPERRRKDYNRNR